MPIIPPALTGCAGEHFVAYRLSAMGYLVALTRGGSPTVDLMVGTPDGKKMVTIQVKTKNKAFSPATKKDPISCWYWQVAAKAKEPPGERFLYAFVNLKGGAGESPKPMPMPEVFIVPADFVAEKMNQALAGSTKNERTSWVSVYGKPPTMFFFHIEAGQDGMEKDVEKKWRENWDLIKERLG